MFKAEEDVAEHGRLVRVFFPRIPHTFLSGTAGSVKATSRGRSPRNKRRWFSAELQHIPVRAKYGGATRPNKGDVTPVNREALQALG